MTFDRSYYNGYYVNTNNMLIQCLATLNCVLATHTRWALLLPTHRGHTHTSGTLINGWCPRGHSHLSPISTECMKCKKPHVSVHARLAQKLCLRPHYVLSIVFSPDFIHVIKSIATSNFPQGLKRHTFNHTCKEGRSWGRGLLLHTVQ